MWTEWGTAEGETKIKFVYNIYVYVQIYVNVRL